MCRFFVASLLGLVLTGSPVAAAGQEGIAADQEAAVVSGVPGLVPTPTFAAVPVAAAAAAEVSSAPQVRFPRAYRPTGRPRALPALYVGSAALQAYDAYSTLTALKAGAVEANPLMKGIVTRPVAFVALKAGVTAFSIAAAERMWKDHNRVGAVLTMVISNGFMTYVAANNARVIGRLR